MVNSLRKALNTLRKQKYHLIGSHSAVKKCYWVHKALTQKHFCYKGKFYGIESHRCIQFSPAVLWCWNSCLHCWRLRPSDVMSWEESLLPSIDDPGFIADAAIEEHRRTISGYFAYPNIDKTMLKEAMTPKHVAISLTGEATLYPRLGELIKEFHNRNLTTFLVTRGIRPDILANLDEEPSQLYVSIEAYDEESYRYFNKPIFPNLWKLTLKTLEILPSFTSPTVIRITLIKGFNNSEKSLKKFAKLISVAQPTFIEVKAYMFIGASMTRLSRESMPHHKEVKIFAELLANEIGYNVVSESKPSRVVLLSKLDKPVIRHGNCPVSWEDPDPGDEFSGEYGEPETAI